jgi:hypothetical protein
LKTSPSSTGNSCAGLPPLDYWHFATSVVDIFRKRQLESGCLDSRST